MKAKEMRQLSAAELTTKVAQWQDELFRNRVKAYTSEVKDTSVFGKLRKDIARGKGILTEMKVTSPSDVVVAPKVEDKPKAQAKKTATKKKKVTKKAEDKGN